jgi:23S rRNA pseudouridine1911/1915/1917 synthase
VEGDIPGNLRLDRYVADHLGLLSRSQIKSRVMEAWINGRPVKKSRIVKGGDKIVLAWSDPPLVDLIPENIALDILYEDERVVVINKAQGMVVHPGAGNFRGTLANALLYRRLSRTGSPAPSGGEAGGAYPASFPADCRPGIVHRLDKDTSGVIIAAYDDGALRFLADQFKTGKTEKRYAALVKGSPGEKQGRIETGISRDPRDRKRFIAAPGGRTALSYYRVIRSWGTHSLMLLRPKTGRTHQLRVHMRHLGHPILGDPLYGVRDGLFPGATLMLHAKSLAIVLPGNGERRIFHSPLPSRFRRILGILREH